MKELKYQCPECKRFFKRPEEYLPINCAVNHISPSCCHYQDEEDKEQQVLEK